MKPTISDIEAAIIYADPPWNYDQRGRGAAENHYRTMTLDDLKALPVSRLASKDAVLFLWATMPLLPEALAVGAAWGFSFKTTAFTWVKYREPSGKPAMGGGMWTRANAELCLLFVRGEPPRRASAAVRQLVENEWPTTEDLAEMPVCDGCCHPAKDHHWYGVERENGDPDCTGAKPYCACQGYRSLLYRRVLSAPRGAHSAKPTEVRRRIDELMGPDLPRVELFARERAPGWVVWGNEIDSDFEMKV